MLNPVIGFMEQIQCQTLQDNCLCLQPQPGRPMRCRFYSSRESGGILPPSQKFGSYRNGKLHFSGILSKFFGKKNKIADSDVKSLAAPDQVRDDGRGLYGTVKL